MKKRLVSIILAVFLILSMMPFSAFADGIVCPACGGTVTKQERRLVSAHDDFYKCDTCGKWAWVNKLGSLKPHRSLSLLKLVLLKRSLNMVLSVSDMLRI